MVLLVFEPFFTDEFVFENNSINALITTLKKTLQENNNSVPLIEYKARNYRREWSWMTEFVIYKKRTIETDNSSFESYAAIGDEKNYPQKIKLQ